NVGRSADSALGLHQSQSGYPYMNHRLTPTVPCAPAGEHPRYAGREADQMEYGGNETGVLVGDGAGARPRLLDEVRARLRLKHYSLRTEQAYLYWIRRYIRSSGMRHPRTLDGRAVEGFLSRLASRDNVAGSTQNRALSALLFLYREVLAMDLPWIALVVRAKRP